jgi:hypothetical protein
LILEGQFYFGRATHRAAVVWVHERAIAVELKSKMPP